LSGGIPMLISIQSHTILNNNQTSCAITKCFLLTSLGCLLNLKVGRLAAETLNRYVSSYLHPINQLIDVFGIIQKKLGALFTTHRICEYNINGSSIRDRWPLHLYH